MEVESEDEDEDEDDEEEEEKRPVLGKPQQKAQDKQPETHNLHASRQ